MSEQPERLHLRGTHASEAELAGRHGSGGRALGDRRQALGRGRGGDRRAGERQLADPMERARLRVVLAEQGLQSDPDVPPGARTHEASPQLECAARSRRPRNVEDDGSPDGAPAPRPRLRTP